MGDGTSAAERLPVSALVSQLLVAFTIEFDNEFEHQMPHRTTNHGSSQGRTSGPGRVPWLVSMAMWLQCMRYVPEDGIPARELARLACLTAHSAPGMLKRMSAWWGLSQLGPGLPDYLPVWELRSGPRPESGGRDESQALALPALMSKVLLIFARDFQRESHLSLGIYTASGDSRLAVSANMLRVLGAGPVRVADIPGRSGVAKMAVGNWLGALEQHGYLTIGADPAGTRFRVAELTPSGRQALDTYRHWAVAVEPRRRACAAASSPIPTAGGQRSAARRRCRTIRCCHTAGGPPMAASRICR